MTPCMYVSVTRIRVVISPSISTAGLPNIVRPASLTCKPGEHYHNVML